jgi:hypothetical protein
MRRRCRDQKSDWAGYSSNIAEKPLEMGDIDPIFGHYAALEAALFFVGGG